MQTKVSAPSSSTPGHSSHRRKPSCHPAATPTENADDRRLVAAPKFCTAIPDELATTLRQLPDSVVLAVATDQRGVALKTLDVDDAARRNRCLAIGRHADVIAGPARRSSYGRTRRRPKSLLGDWQQRRHCADGSMGPAPPVKPTHAGGALGIDAERTRQRRHAAAVDADIAGGNRAVRAAAGDEDVGEAVAGNQIRQPPGVAGDPDRCALATDVDSMTQFGCAVVPEALVPRNRAADWRHRWRRT